ncbi:MAG TPA: hypothetical protein VI461_08030 [Chitinophagaceae bacterium]|nr:hypothetical protein [Chitinophagaceae bacterium]
MKRSNINHSVKNILAVCLTAVMIFMFSSCARKITFLPSTVVPAAEGFVKVNKDKNNNYVIKIELINLAEPNKLQPPKKTYVVWMDANQELTKNLGQINSSSSLLSQKLKASFETVSPVKPTKIFITAEDDASIQYPGWQIILSTNSF